MTNIFGKKNGASATLSEEDSRLLASLAQAIAYAQQGVQVANVNFQIAFEQACRRTGKDPAKYTVMPTPGMAGRIDLVLKEQLETLAQAGPQPA